jgi:hypothetical protein
MAMKEDILNYFRSDRSYDGAVTLYLRYGNRIGLMRQLNVQPQSDHMLNILHEELRQLAGITTESFRSLMLAPPTSTPVVDPPKPVVSLTPAGKVKRQQTKAPTKAKADKAGAKATKKGREPKAPKVPQDPPASKGKAKKKQENPAATPPADPQ